jgi:hypothetical protein
VREVGQWGSWSLGVMVIGGKAVVVSGSER